MQSRMDETEYYSELARLGLNPNEAALLVTLKTSAVINPKDTLRQFNRKGSLSNRETAMYRLLFKTYRGKKKHA